MRDEKVYFLHVVWIIAILFCRTPILHAEKHLGLWPTSKWKISSPEKHGINSSMLDEMFTDKRFKGNLLLVRYGFLVAERYDQEKGKKYAPHIYSCTKGIISALIGIALYQRNLTSIHQNVLDFFPDFKRVKRDEQKQQITLYHLLTMTSGLWWTDVASVRIIYDEPDWSKYILEKPMVASPGVRFNYSSGNAHLLSAILQKATKMTSLEYAQRYLFKPLGISVVEWEKNPNNVYLGGWGVKMTLEDMARFGYLYLRKGKWKDHQVIPAEWVRVSLQQHVKQTKDWAKWGYGYMWNAPPDMPYATSSLIGGNRHYTYSITLIPDLDIVLVYAGLTNHNEMLQLMKTYLLPSVTPKMKHQFLQN
jgi:CubicO group peptidase (beta-lactamase class C family)